MPTGPQQVWLPVSGTLVGGGGEHKGTKGQVWKGQNKLPGGERGLFSFPFSNRYYVRVAVETFKQN